MIYHVLNRGNCRMEIFSKDGDYAAFLKLLEQGRQQTGMRLLAYCLMPNHWRSSGRAATATWPASSAGSAPPMCAAGVPIAEKKARDTSTRGGTRVSSSRVIGDNYNSPVTTIRNSRLDWDSTTMF